MSKAASLDIGGPAFHEFRNVEDMSAT